MELINKDTPQVKEFISSLDSMLSGIESIVKHYKPHLNGERFLSNHEVSKKLNVSWKIQCKLPPKTKRFCPLVLK